MKETNPFYRTAAWQRAREAALMRDHYMCRDCMERYEQGYGIRPQRAQMVHHLIPVERRPDLALELSNLISLCYRCHERRHPEKRSERTGKAEPKRMRIIKI